MSRLPLVPGTPLPDARRRMVGNGFWMDTPTGDGIDASTSSALSASCTASGTPHTKGAWTQLIAATTKPTNLLRVVVTNQIAANTVDTSTLLDIGIGGAGAEVAIVPNLPVGYTSSSRALWEIPVHIPNGSRIAIRAQSLVASQAVTVGLQLSLLPFGKQSPTHLVNIGANTAASTGTVLTAPGALNTKGAWTELTAATTEPFGALAIGVQGGGATVLNSSGVLVDVGVGASGSEVVRIADLAFMGVANTEAYLPLSDMVLPVSIPLGARIAARYQRANAANTVDVAVLGVPRQ